MAFRRERFQPFGGPSGGDGGDGGDVVFLADPGKRTLLDFQYKNRFQARRGKHGEGSDKKGKSGEDLIIAVPPGTMIYNARTGELIEDLAVPHARVVVAKGGRGGWGNARFATATNRTPRRSDPGGAPEKLELRLELKLLADAGLVGHPNAGKSTLLASVSAARPKIADYPFTTLSPNLGLVRVGNAESFLLADIPGLIEGASKGKGLGLDFLRHIERCRVLIYLIDAVSEDPVGDLRILREELGRYREDLAGRPSLVVWNKMDAVDRPEDLPVLSEGEFRISAVTGEGVVPFLFEVQRLIKEGECEEGG